MIDKDGNKQSQNAKVFSLHKDEEFQSALASLIERAYSELFELYGPDTWTLEQGNLITFVRSSDQSSDLVGKRQANTFSTLCAIAGKRQISASPRNNQQPDATKTRKAKPKTIKPPTEAVVRNDKVNNIESRDNNGNDIALTVRIEINLPAQGDQETYDRIFKNIRENFINGR